MSPSKSSRASARRARARVPANQAQLQRMEPGLRQVFNNPSSATREMLVTLVDFLESPGEALAPYQQYQLDMRNPLGLEAGTTGVQSPLARVTSFKLFALPRSVNAAVASAVLAVNFGLPVTVGSAAASGGTAAVKTTVLTPTSVLDWVLVGEWTEATVSSTAQQLLSVDGRAVLGTWGLFDPDTWTASPDVVQYMVEVTVAQALPNWFTISGATVTSAATTAYSSALVGTPASQGLMVEALSTRKTE